MNYIGFVGAKGAGKTSSLNLLAKNYNVNEIMIAKKLKEVCSSILGIPMAWMGDPKLKEILFETPHTINSADLSHIINSFDLGHVGIDYGVHIGAELRSPRHAAQYVGTDIVRAADRMAHLRSAARQASPNGVNIVTDIRFPNEYDYFKNKDEGFVLCYIQRKEAEEEAAKDVHSSEAGLKDLIKKADIIIDNNGSWEQLEENLAPIRHLLMENYT